MTITEPIPASGYGAADWVDYSNYWREKDAEWMQERLILRYASPALRSTQYPSPKPGHVTYNETSDRLEVYSKGANAWATVQHFINLTSGGDSNTNVNIAHKDAVGKGINFQPTVVAIDTPTTLVGGGVLKVESGGAAGVTVQTGTKAAKLTTSATNLVVDSPVSAPGGTLTGALSGTTADFSGLVGAASVTVKAGGTLTVPNIALSGTLTGGIVNGASGTIGGVAMSGNQITATSTAIFNSISIDGGVIRYRNPVGPVLSNSMINPTNDFIRFRTTSGIPLDNPAGAWQNAWVGFVYTANIDPALVPPGSLLFL